MTGYETGFREGEATYEAGQPGAEANPHRPGTDEAAGWRAGWKRARDNEELAAADELREADGMVLGFVGGPEYDDAPAPRTYGYARISARDQNLALQLDALAAARVDEVVQEQGSGTGPRPLLAALLARLVSGDQLVVWKLDRLGRRAADVILTVDDLRRRGIVVRSLTEGIDARTPAGRAFVGFLAVFAEMEKELIKERRDAGIAISRREGRHGRPRRWDPEQVRHAADLIAAGTSLRQAARRVGLPRATLSDALARLAPTSPASTA